MIKIPETERLYYILTNVDKINHDLLERGYDNIVYVEGGDINTRLSKESEVKIADSEKGIMFLWYYDVPQECIDEGVDETVIELRRQLRDTLRKRNRSYHEFCSLTPFDCSINDKDSYLNYIMSDGFIEKTADDYGWIIHTDYTNRCGNCKKYMNPEAKYCVICGTRRGEGRFEPYTNLISHNAAYGSPMISEMICEKCGQNYWSDMNDYCEKCGGKLIISRTTDYDTWTLDEAIRKEAARVADNLPNTIHDYYLFVNLPEIKTLLEENGFDNVVLISGDVGPLIDLESILNPVGKHQLHIWFESEEEHGRIYDYTEPHYTGRWYTNYNLNKFIKYWENPDVDEEYEDSVIEDKKEFIQKVNDYWQYIRGYADAKGWVLHTDFTNTCGNCDEYIGPDEKYCHACGTKRGEGKFVPYKNRCDILYGPPTIFTYRCPQCLTEWFGTVWDKRAFCTECGKRAEIIDEKEDPEHPWEF